MKIAYASVFDPLSLSSWSGSSYHLAKALSDEDSVSVDFVGPLTERASPIYAIKKFWYRLRGKNYLANLDPGVLKEFARQTSSALNRSDADVILSLDALPIAHLETSRPIVYFWDCTFLGNLEYPWFNNLAPECIAYGHQMEQLALDRCHFAVFSSDWAVRTAVEGYRIDDKKLRVVSLGANVDCTRTVGDVERIVEARSAGECKLLFVGVDWKRKGGRVAVEVARQLNARGLPTTLTTIGCNPEFDGSKPSFVRSLGFVDKLHPDNQKLIEGLHAESHFLILPSIADATPIVLCEANSFGTPALATRVGGIPSVVNDDVNGKLFTGDAPISEYCDYVLGMFNPWSRYKQLALSSYAEYSSRLNWRRTSKDLLQLMRAL